METSLLHTLCITSSTRPNVRRPRIVDFLLREVMDGCSFTIVSNQIWNHEISLAWSPNATTFRPILGLYLVFAPSFNGSRWTNIEPLSLSCLVLKEQGCNLRKF